MGTLSISTNTSALNVQRNLTEANDRSASSLAKLSSGSRVPTARDDAASLAIGSRLEAEVAGLNQASINASQATSMLQIADGALSEVNDILVRLKSLSVQSASGQLSDSERVLLDSEFQQLLSEVDRISQDTEFNGNQLLNGGDVVATTNEVKTGSLSSKGMAISYDTNKVVGTQDTDGDGNIDNQGYVFDVAYDATAETVTLTNRTTNEVVTQDITTALNDVAGTGNNLPAGKELKVEFADLGVTITLNEDFDRAANFDNDLSVSNSAGVTYTGASVAQPATFNEASLKAITGAAGFNAATNTFSLATDDTGAGAVAVNGMANIEISVDGAAFGAAGAGVANIADGSSHDLILRDATTGAELFSVTTGVAVGTTSGAGTLDVTLPDNMWAVQEDTQNTATFSYQIGTGTSSSDTLDVTVNGASTTALGINSSNIATQASANAAINEVGDAIDRLQDVRAQVGASLSRLDFASSNLSVTIENSESAKSGLLDVDVASETTKYTAEQVIVQAGVSLLAQANQRPNTLLTLLQQ